MTRLFLSLFLFFECLILNAQNSVLSSGKDAIGSGGGASYSVGQVFFNSLESSSGTVSEGVQQTYVISENPNPDPTDNINNSLLVDIKVYPNPIVDKLIVKQNELFIDGYSYFLTDVSGKVLTENTLNSTETEIDMYEYSSATYFLKIKKNDSEIKTFKIIKN